MPDRSARHLPNQAFVPGPGAKATSAGRVFANPVVLKSVDSTNRYVAAAARAGAEEGLVVVADVQTAGRGRHGRSWLSPKGSSLLCSFLFRPELSPVEFHLLPTIVGLSARQVIGELTGVDADLKWPNDILIGEKKVAGILSEVVPADPGGGREGVVVGIGVNLSWPEGFPPREGDAALVELATSATTIAQVSGRTFDRDVVLDALVSCVEQRYAPMCRDPAPRAAKAEVMASYRAACSTTGRRVRVEGLTTTFEADALAVDDDGRLIVITEGRRQAIDAADVVHLSALDRRARD